MRQLSEADRRRIEAAKQRRASIDLEAFKQYAKKFNQHEENITLSFPYDSPEAEVYPRLLNPHMSAWAWFYPEGFGFAKPGFHLHHKDPALRHEDLRRYEEWRIEDLVMLSSSEHLRWHKMNPYKEHKAV